MRLVLTAFAWMVLVFGFVLGMASALVIIGIGND